MDALPDNPSCKACGSANLGNYCANCGQKVKTGRITMSHLFHEVFHFFTHLDKGFPHTLKSLVKEPGRMQKDYLEGNRARHQKPFSMFFLSATVSALIYYWTNQALQHYWASGDQQEAEFFNHYWVILHICLFPLYALTTYLCFKKAGYYYGEIAVFQLYTFSIIFLIVSLIQLGKLIYPSLETRYIELPALLLYTTITNLRFFSSMKPIPVIALSVLNIGLTFLVASACQDAMIGLLSKK